MRDDSFQQYSVDCAGSRANRLGGEFDGNGVNFALFPAHATPVELCLYTDDGQHEIARLGLPLREGEIWHGYVPGLHPGQVNAYRVPGRHDPAAGDRFNPAKLLIDPCARELCGDPVWDDALVGYAVGQDDLSLDDRDSARFIPKAVVVDPAFAGEVDRTLRHRWDDSVIYEAHVKGRTKRHPDAPHCAYLKSGSGRDVKEAVKRFHAAGIEVILDVVYNHTAEGNEMEPSLSFRGVDNASYHLLSRDNPRHSCGNTLNIDHPMVLPMVLDSPRYWLQVGHVEGVLFDPASSLGRASYGFEREGAFFAAITQDPILSSVTLNAEPWDIGVGSYQVGGVPWPFREWNDKFRDDTLAFWRRDDGFTRWDTRSYNEKYDGANGEDRADGLINTLATLVSLRRDMAVAQAQVCDDDATSDAPTASLVHPDGRVMGAEDWQSQSDRCLGLHLTTSRADLFILMNAGNDAVFTLPNGTLQTVIDTACDDVANTTAEDPISIGWQSVQVYRAI